MIPIRISQLVSAAGQALSILIFASALGLGLGYLRGTLGVMPHPGAPAPRTAHLALPAQRQLPAPAPAAPGSAPKAAQPAPQAAKTPRADALPSPGQALSPRQAQRLLATGAVAVDARRPEDYALGHLPGAVSLPVEEFDFYFPRSQARLDPNAPLVIYCGGGECTLSHELADTLTQMGFRQVHVLTGGIDAWRAAGLRVVR